MKKILENFSFKRYILQAIVFLIVSLIIGAMMDGFKSINILNTLTKSLIFSFIMSLIYKPKQPIKQSDEQL
jgi:hypothetical protein